MPLKHRSAPTSLASLALMACLALVTGCADVSAVNVDAGDTRDATAVEPERDAAVGCTLGRYGTPCVSGDACCSGLCVEAQRGSICSDRCSGPEDCPPGARCAALDNAGVDVTFICVPDLNALCQPCQQDDDCDDPQDRCLPIGRGMHCGDDCTDSPCPEGYTCEDVPGEVGQSTRQCLPETGLCEGCVDPDGDGYGAGVDCAGIDCDETDTAVNAGGAESCNGADDDCDFRVDEALATPAGICLALGICAQAAPLCLLGEWDCRYPPTQGDEGDFDCDNLDNDCDGLVDEYHDTASNPEHCGRCGNRCTFANAVPACGDGRCQMGPCRAGWVDLNGIPADGCEVECFFQSADDRPDRANIDANCDGLDGDAARAVYVDPLSGDDAFDGSRRSPLRTLAAALALAATRGHDVYASHGVYAEVVEVVPGVSIYGGYDAGRGWRRDGGLETVIRGGARSAYARDVMTPTELQRLRIESTDAQGPGASSIALTISDSIGLTVRDCTISAGRGGDGQRGRDGDSGPIGQPGTLGQDAQDSSNIFQNCDRRQGGNGGQTSCDDGPTHGGRGGNGGVDDGNGEAGQFGQGPTGGGNGGGGGNHDGSCGDTDPGARGGTGTRGVAGPDGAAGLGAGQIVAGEWIGTPGGDGVAGTSGSGGGGGGGGGGQEERAIRIPPCDRGCGGGGGGGGAGGCRGTGATGGGAGGASIAVLIIDANPTLVGNQIRAGRGGTGGEGGRGGEGGAGGGPGGGGPGSGDIGGGGQGGPGGDGGRGGHGGGGPGGPSLGVVTAGTSAPDLADNGFVLAGGGEPGQSPGNPGAVGVTAEVQAL